MDEQKNQQNQNPTVPDYTAEINAMYDAQRQQQLQSLESAYNQNTQTLQSSLKDVSRNYGAKANDLNAQYERSRMAMNEQMAANGLNVGAGSQAGLAQQSNYLNAFGKIGAEQANAEQNINQQIANLEMTYKNAVSDAIAKNDHERAAALLAEYKRRDEAAKEQQRYNDNWALNKAQTLAQYGNFSGYAELYGQDVANAMQQYYDMMNGGGSSSRSGGYGGSGGSGGGGGGDNGTGGPGKFGGGGDTGRNNNVYDGPVDAGTAAYLAGISKYGSDEAYYEAQLRSINQQSQSAALDAAYALGLPEGSNEFLRFINDYTAAANAQNDQYFYYKDELNKAQQRRKEENEATKKVAEQQKKDNTKKEMDRLLKDDKKNGKNNNGSSTSNKGKGNTSKSEDDWLRNWQNAQLGYVPNP